MQIQGGDAFGSHWHLINQVDECNDCLDSQKTAHLTHEYIAYIEENRPCLAEEHGNGTSGSPASHGDSPQADGEGPAHQPPASHHLRRILSVATLLKEQEALRLPSDRTELV